MPLVNVRLIEGVFDAAEKQEMVEKLTETMVEIEGENLRGATVVIIDDRVLPGGAAARPGAAHGGRLWAAHRS